MYWIVFIGNNIILKEENGEYSLPQSDEQPYQESTHSQVLDIPALNGIPVRTFRLVTLPQAGLQGDCVSMELRSSFHYLSHDEYLLAGKAAELLYWHENTRFCGRCGGAMEFHTAISKRCMVCGKEVWPHVSPAIIVRIRRKAEYDVNGTEIRPEQILLVHARNFRRADYYGLVAGFVETGETLEECVRREVKEETSIVIENLQYFGSQPWPYPSGIMVAFTADYVRGELHLQETELSRAGWYDRQHMPPVPDESSIARWLIDDWVSFTPNAGNEQERLNSSSEIPLQSRVTKYTTRQH